MNPDDDELTVERNIATAARDMGDAIEDRIKRAIREHATLTPPEAMGLLSLAGEVLLQAGAALLVLVRASDDMKRDGDGLPPATPPSMAAKCRHEWVQLAGNPRPTCRFCAKPKAANGRKPAAATVAGVTKLDPVTQPLPLDEVQP